MSKKDRENSKNSTAVVQAGFNANGAKIVSPTYQRSLYENKVAMNNFKNQAFNGGKYIKDAYSSNRLYQTKAEAVAKYGDNFNNHLAQTDHTVPLKKVYEKYRNNPFMDDESIRELANLDENYAMINGHINQSKGELSNIEYVEKNSQKLSESTQTAMIDEHGNAVSAMQNKAMKKQIQAAGKAFALGAAVGGTASAISNIRDYQNGEIDAGTAALNIAKDTVTSGGKATVSAVAINTTGQMLINKTAGTAIAESCEKFVAGGGVAKAAIVLAEVGKSTVRYLKGDITGEEFASELTEKGVSLSTSFTLGAQFGVVGGLVGGVPGAVIGEIVGNIVGYTMGSKIFEEVKAYRDFVNSYNPEELRRYREIYDNTAQNLRHLREAYEIKMQMAFRQEADTINTAMLGIKDAIVENNTDKMNMYLGNLCEHFGFELRFKSLQEFDDFMMSDEVEVW